MRIVEPSWSIAESTRAFSTTRDGGVSAEPWDTLNLGDKGGDDPAAVASNRARLAERLPAEPCWLRQVHGTRVVHLRDWAPDIEADAAWTDRAGEVVAILTADCLPILLADRDGTFVAGVHGGWRSLQGGIVEAVLAALPCDGEALCAWIGPGICGDCYQVGDEVRAAFVEDEPSLEPAFEPDGARWRADLKAIARQQLERRGVAVNDAGLCTFEDAERFYSYRRDGRSGRMATLIWKDR